MGFVCLKTEISSYHYPSGGEGRAGYLTERVKEDQALSRPSPLIVWDKPVLDVESWPEEFIFTKKKQSV